MHSRYYCIVYLHKKNGKKDNTVKTLIYQIAMDPQKNSKFIKSNVVNEFCNIRMPN